MVSVFLAANIILFHYESEQYRKSTNDAIGSLIAEIQEKYTDVSETDIIQILNGDAKKQELTQKYGIDLTNDSILLKNSTITNQYYIYSSILILIFAGAVIVIFYCYHKHENNKINDIIQCLEKINQKNYELVMDSNDESDLAVLKNELYKTTIMLKEESENAKKDKSSIKTSMEDISHQLKTPLTSISIMLDNLMDDPDMDQATRNEFISDIKRETLNINFLVQSLLKLSRFDVNSVEFNNQEYSLKEMVRKAIQNNASLCDLRNVSVATDVQEEIHLNCDFNWQVEALSNILKDSIEHSPADSTVSIQARQTKLYTEVQIKDTGIGMDEEDKKHVFERFYKGKNASKDGVGIGLSLAKTIIENNNGTVSVESIEGKGTTFTIRYINTLTH
jgi:signal transduction histidine kinase